jgi:poly-beta-1,6-N-acetyl-D-glucosamine biosynthesis protein PgaD
MGESGQRPSYPEFIDQTGLKSKKRIFVEIFITLGFWGLILYLLWIIITFILWALGFELVYSRLIYAVGYQEMLTSLEKAAMVTSIILFLQLIWAYYNYILFKIRGERRTSQVRICFDNDMADFFKVNVDVLEKVKNYSSVSVFQNENNIGFIVSKL